MAEPRSPRDVPDDPATPAGPLDRPSAPPFVLPFVPDLDTDGDGVPDTAVGDDGVDLVLATDLDGDGLADQIVRIGPDGFARMAEPPAWPAGAPEVLPAVLPDHHA